MTPNEFHPTSVYKLVNITPNPNTPWTVQEFPVMLQEHPTNPELVIGYHQLGGPGFVNERAFVIKTGMAFQAEHFKWRIVST